MSSPSPYALMVPALDARLDRYTPATKCCWKLSLTAGVKAICVFMGLNAIYFFVTSAARWGKPCYHWYDHWATCITFFAAHTCRVAMLVVPVKAASGDAQSLNLFKYLLLVLVVVCLLDIFLVVFEVFDVCSSQYVLDYHLEKCRQEKLTTEQCDARNLSEGMCELVSDVYDIGIGLVAAALFSYFMFIVHCRQKEALEEARRGLASGGADAPTAQPQPAAVEPPSSDQ